MRAGILQTLCRAAVVKQADRDATLWKETTLSMTTLALDYIVTGIWTLLEAKATRKKEVIVIKETRNWLTPAAKGQALYWDEPSEVSDVVDLGVPRGFAPAAGPRRRKFDSVQPLTLLRRVIRRSPAPLPNPRLYQSTSAKRKPAETQAAGEGSHIKKHKRRYRNPVPNSRLYRPAPPRRRPSLPAFSYISQRLSISTPLQKIPSLLAEPKCPRSHWPKPTPLQKVPSLLPEPKCPRSPWPKPTPLEELETASRIIVALTEQICTQRAQKRRPRSPSAPKSTISRKSSARVQQKPKVTETGRLDKRKRQALVVNLPKLPPGSVRSECSSHSCRGPPERIKDIVRRARQHRLSHVRLNAAPLQDDLWGERDALSKRFARSPEIFARILSLNSPIDQRSEAGDHLVEPLYYSPSSSFFRDSSPKKLSPTRRPSFFQRTSLSKTSLIPEECSPEDRSLSPLGSEEQPASRPAWPRSAPRPKAERNKAEEVKKINMEDKPDTVGKDRGSQHSTSPEDFSVGNESLSAPSEFLAEFLSAIMQRKYVNALKYCKLILKYEPNNVTAKEFYPLLEEKLKNADKEEGSSGTEQQSAEKSPTELSEGSNQNTDDKDEGSSYNSDDSYLLDDELEEEAEDEEGRADDAADAEGSPLTSSSSHQRTDSDRSLPSSGETDNSANNLSGYEDEDSSKYDDDNGNAVCAGGGAFYARTSGCFAPAVADAAHGEPNDNDNANASSTANLNYEKNQEELRRLKIRQLRSQFVHGVK